MVVGRWSLAKTKVAAILPRTKKAPPLRLRSGRLCLFKERRDKDGGHLTPDSPVLGHVLALAHAGYHTFYRGNGFDHVFG